MSVVSEATLRPAVLDEAHLGHIHGALGTIRHGDVAPRRGWWARLRTLFSPSSTPASSSWSATTMPGPSAPTRKRLRITARACSGRCLLVPVLYVNQEMVLRLGAVSGVGHARLILDRFGGFWGAFSVVDPFLLNALTIVTEFIGLTLAFDYVGFSHYVGVLAAGLVLLRLVRLVAAGT